MASPVDTSVKFFHSGQIGAPVLTGAVGSMIALLDACLVNGFGLKSVTSLVVSGGVATITITGTHSAQVDTVILVDGVTNLTTLNGEQKVTAVTGSTISFATAAANGTAAGTITVKQAPAGWAKPYTGTNLAVYRSNDVTSNRRYVRIADTATNVSRVVVYETMTAVSTGTGPMPTAAQVSGGAYLTKLLNGLTSTESSGWAIFANGKRVLIFVADYLSQGAQYRGGRLFGFGDFPSVKSGDVYNTFLSAGNSPDPSDSLAMLGAGSGYNFIWIQRLHTAAAGARVAEKHSVEDGNFAGEGSYGPLPVPTGGGGGLLLVSSTIACEPMSTNGVRGFLPGLWQTPQMVAAGVFTHGDIVPGIGSTAGRRLFAVHSTQGGQYLTPEPGTFIDITGPWPGD